MQLSTVIFRIFLSNLTLTHDLLKWLTQFFDILTEKQLKSSFKFSLTLPYIYHSEANFFIKNKCKNDFIHLKISHDQHEDMIFLRDSIYSSWSSINCNGINKQKFILPLTLKAHNLTWPKFENLSIKWILLIYKWKKRNQYYISSQLKLFWGKNILNDLFLLTQKLL